MAIKQLVKFFLGRKEDTTEIIDIINKIQDQINPIINLLSSQVFANGNIFNNQVLVAGQDNLIPHLLGTSYKHYNVLNKNANADVWEVSNPNPDKFLSLRTSADVTISIFISSI